MGSAQVSLSSEELGEQNDLPESDVGDTVCRGEIESLQAALHAAQSQAEQQQLNHATLQEEVTRTHADLKEIETLFRESERVG